MQLMCSSIDYKYSFPGTTSAGPNGNPRIRAGRPYCADSPTAERTRCAAVHAQRRACDPGRRRRLTGAARPLASGRPPLPAAGAPDDVPPCACMRRPGLPPGMTPSRCPRGRRPPLPAARKTRRPGSLMWRAAPAGIPMLVGRPARPGRPPRPSPPARRGTETGSA